MRRPERVSEAAWRRAESESHIVPIIAATGIWDGWRVTWPAADGTRRTVEICHSRYQEAYEKIMTWRTARAAELDVAHRRGEIVL